MASELKPCPFCSKTMMLRSALWPSEGDADAIIHADHTDCPMLGFSDGSADGSIIEKWNYSLSNEDDFPSDGSCVRCGSVPRNANGLCNTCLDEDAEHLENTRPSPVAPVTSEPWGYGWYEQGGKKMASGYLPTINYPRSEDVTEGPSPLYTAPQQPAVSPDATGKRGELETVAQAHFDEFGEFDDIAWIKGFHPHPECIQLVTRSQAEELLAAERAKKEMLAESLHIQIKRVNELESDNAALTARVKELKLFFKEHAALLIEYENTCISQIKDVNTIEDNLRAETELRKYHQKRNKELEAKLAAAEKALEPFAAVLDDYDPDWEDDDVTAVLVAGSVTHYGITLGDFRQARATLGGKS